MFALANGKPAPAPLTIHAHGRNLATSTPRPEANTYSPRQLRRGDSERRRGFAAPPFRAAAAICARCRPAALARQVGGARRMCMKSAAYSSRQPGRAVYWRLRDWSPFHPLNVPPSGGGCDFSAGVVGRLSRTECLRGKWGPASL
jgi:hypothetical protein